MFENILVVGTEPSNLVAIRETLQDYRVLTAENCLEVTHQLEICDDIAIVILDSNASEAESVRILETVKSHTRDKSLYTIILKHANEQEIELAGMKWGVTDYICKPIHPPCLKARIDRYLQFSIQKQMEQTIQKQDMLFNAIFHQAPIGIVISHGSVPDSSGSDVFFDVNPMFEHITGRTRQELIESGWIDITHPDDVDADIQNFRKLQASEIKSYAMEKRYIRPDGSVVWVDMNVAPMKVSGREAETHICLVQDITKRKEIEKSFEESERSKAVLLSHLPGMAYRCNYDPEWTMRFVSAGCLELTGYTSEELLYNKKLSYNDLVVSEYRNILRKEWKRVLHKRIPFKQEYEITSALGVRKWVLEMGQGVFDDAGQVEALEGIILDISDRKKFESGLTYHNEHDVWTGLYNRRYFENLFREDVRKRTAGRRAVVSVNLNSVYVLSTTYGFQYSQDLIKRIADVLRTHCDERHLLFNSYEYRFVFYVKNYTDKPELTQFCKAVSDTLESILAIERIGWGIGIIEIDMTNRQDVDQLLRNLLVASEKALGNFESDFGFCFFDKDMEDQVAREKEIVNELTQIAAGKDSGRLFLLFQPILDLASNEICGFEALARLRSDKLGLVAPLEFIPIAEKTKLIIPLGEVIILQAFHFLHSLESHGYRHIGVSINVSAMQLLRHNFINQLVKLIRETQVDPTRISIEITESIIATNFQEINTIFGELKNLGIKIALDDFGTGYSSLARERDLNINCIKIDKSFIDNLMVVRPEVAITGDIISMAHRLGHYVVAEGIEHEQQRRYLEEHGCDKIQGYLVSKPVEESAVFGLLAATNGSKNTRCSAVGESEGVDEPQDI